MKREVRPTKLTLAPRGAGRRIEAQGAATPGDVDRCEIVHQYDQVWHADRAQANPLLSSLERRGVELRHIGVGQVQFGHLPRVRRSGYAKVAASVTRVIPGRIGHLEAGGEPGGTERRVAAHRCR